MKKETETDILDLWEPEPRWHALLAGIAVGGLYTALPQELVAGPRWLFPALVLTLIALTIITHTGKYHRLDRFLGFILSCVLTLGMIASVVLLVQHLSDKKETPQELLISAGLLWFTNIIVFALWYWRLDAGGPHRRERRFGHADGAFLFPQMTMPPEAKAEANQEEWSPNFIDYLFIAFNTSTAFSPTDVPVLTRWAKVLMMLQSVISLTVIALLAARAINTLPGIG